MAKRKQAKFSSKSRKSALRIEPLEQRQLLATVNGQADYGPAEYQNIRHPNGNVYDQVLMPGQAITVESDPGQITRVSFLDPNGDIVQAEFSGQGTMQVSLDPATFAGAKVAEKYNQPGVQYVTGKPTFTFQNTDANTNFNVFSVGPGTAVNQTLFEGGRTGGNNIADVQAIVVLSNAASGGGFSNFGRITAGNAVFTGSVGNVGITAAGVNVVGPVVIGDIDASSVGVPVLNFGAGSAFNTLTVAGGDLVQTNGALILTGFGAGGTTAGISSVNFTAGATSKVKAGEAPDLRALVNPSADIFTAVDPARATLDVATSFDITGKTQAQIDDMFLGRTFTNAVTIKGELAVNNSISVAAFRNGVTFEKSVLGNVTAKAGDLGPVTVKGVLGGDLAATNGLIGTLTVNGDLSGLVRARSIGDVIITGNLSGSLTTDVVVSNNLWDTGEGRIGNVTINSYVEDDGDIAGGNISGGGAIEGVLGIGNVTVARDITSHTGDYLAVLSTFATGSGDAYVGNIGTLTVQGDIDQEDTDNRLVYIGGNGAFGDVLVKGGSGLSNGPTQIGAFTVIGHLGSEAAKTGSITITEADENVEWAGMRILGSFGTVGLVTFKGDSDISFTLDGDVIATGSDMSVQGITVTGFKSIRTDGEIDLHKGPITLTTANVDGATIVIDAIIGENGVRDTGTVTLNAGSGAGSLIDLNNLVAADDLGTVNMTARTIDLSGGGIQADNSAKDIVLNGNTILANDSIKISSRKNLANLTINGTTTVSGTQTFGSVTGALSLNGAVTVGAGGQFLFQGDVASIVIGGDIDMSANTKPSFYLNDETGDNGSSTDVLGSLTINGQVKGKALVTEVRASSIGAVTIKAVLTQDEALVQDFDILAAPNGDTSTDGSEKVSRDGSNLGNYAIGNIRIESVLDFAFTGSALFKGDNTFAALGRIGDISIVGGTRGMQQSRLFSANTDSAWFAAGDVDGLMNTTANMPAGEANVFLYDFNSDGNADDRSGAVDYTGGTFSIGNVLVNAMQTAVGFGVSGVDDIAGSDAAAGGSPEGLAILAGVRQLAATGDLITYGAAGATVVNAVDIDADVKGTLGNVILASYNAVGFVDPVALGALVGPVGDTASAILAATSVGAVQGITPAVGVFAGLNEAGDAAIIGDLDATADDTVEGAAGDTDDATENQIVVVIV